MIDYIDMENIEDKNTKHTRTFKNDELNWMILVVEEEKEHLNRIGNE